MMPLINLLMATGPSLIRLAGELLGANGKAVADKVADVVHAASGLSPAVADAQVTAVLQQLSPAELQQFQTLKNQLEQIAAEREKNQLDYQRAIYAEEQSTQRDEVKYGTDYVKETRPRLARLSAYCGFAYVLVLEAIKALAALNGASVDGASWDIAGALLSPCLAYMGMRTIDAFSKWKTAPAAVLAELPPTHR